jgi:hypothetical protein
VAGITHPPRAASGYLSCRSRARPGQPSPATPAARAATLRPRVCRTLTGPHSGASSRAGRVAGARCYAPLVGLRQRIELADPAALAAQREHLEKGGIIVPCPSLPRGSDCELELVNPAGTPIVVTALIAWVSDSATYFAFRDTSPAAMEAIQIWAAEVPPETADGGAALDDAAAAAATIDGDGDDLGDGDGDDLADGTAADARSSGSGRARRFSRNVNERMRGLTQVEQLKVARGGELAERTVLERLYGKVVWEALLRNPRLTLPEVAHLARMGSMPRMLMELMVSNGGWLQSPQVRRALLGNPKLGPEQIERVLRHVAKSELRLIASQTVYPLAVRSAAKRMLHGNG